MSRNSRRQPAALPKARNRQQLPSKPKDEELNALPFPGIGLAILTRDRVHGRGVENDRFLRGAVFGGRFRVEQLEKIPAAHSAGNNSIHWSRRQRRRLRLLLLARARSRCAIRFREHGTGSGRDEAKDEQAGFHNDGMPVQSGRLHKSKRLSSRGWRSAPRDLSQLEQSRYTADARSTREVRAVRSVGLVRLSALARSLGALRQPRGDLPR